MEIERAEDIAVKAFGEGKIKYIDDTDNYFLIHLNLPDNTFDSIHMLNKQTEELQPFNPILLKGNK